MITGRDNKTKRIHIKQLASLLLVVVMTCSGNNTVYAAEQNNGKEEVVYGILNNDGSVNGVYVVNIFDQKGNIIDYGNYSSVRNMTSKDGITLDNNKVTFANTQDKLYYEGTLKVKELPWNISVKYFIDGKEYTADDIAGKSGAFKIKINITQNENCKSTFYKNYALQTTVTLDTNKCSNIVSDNATIVNVGSDKQLTYTILPNKGADITITAQVNDLEMDAITINGVQLNLDIQIDDSKLKDKIKELTNGVAKIDNGANDLHSGVSELKDGTNTLTSGAKALKGGSSDLNEGVKSLQAGVSKMQDALNRLNSKSDTLNTGSSQVKDALIKIQSSLSAVSLSTDKLTELVNASSQIKTAINQIYTGIGTLQINVGFKQYKAAMATGSLDIDKLQAGNKNAIDSMNVQIATLTKSYNQMKDVTKYESQAAQLKAQIDQLSSLVILLNGNSAAIGGTETYLNNVTAAISKLYTGAGQLNSKYATFDAAIAELNQSLSGILVNMSKLSDGINTLVDKYSTLNKGINDYTTGVAQIVSSYSGIVDGVNQLSDGSERLANGNQKLYESTNDLTAGVSALYNGSNDLADGTGKFKDKTANMDSEVNDQIDSVLSELKGDGSKTVSFSSGKNNEVKSVQFVLKTQQIEKKEVVKSTEKKEKKLNVWQKFLNLFGLE
ncbi:coiled-coil domain-containing protein [Anaeromicropila herbilytica]|uniref:X-X-X-Leu-X-X-Gly heptad repeat-containing protein n=1 Tax=Anaeromicropila herbilytica TaxID=2785025 RepID=A0A7R7EIQ9_9FIRM|nr:hypothetical protein [Anaeromicropila herbilytica]BCN29177.1 hypothetical protein bsdtb5_04720 [Anaeromicropila herbilytica]